MLDKDAEGVHEYWLQNSQRSWASVNGRRAQSEHCSALSIVLPGSHAWTTRFSDGMSPAPAPALIIAHR